MTEPRKISGKFACQLARDAAPTDWLIKGLLPRKGDAALVGAPGMGKSFVALSLACHVAYGKEWLGCEVPEPSKVVYLASEAGGGIANRLKAVQESGFDLNDPDHASNLFVITQQVNIFDRFQAAWMAAQLKEHATDCADLLVVDTLHRSSAGMEENASRDIGLLLENLLTLKEELGNPMILFIHHPGLNGAERGRGSGALDGAWETSFFLKKENKVLLLKNTKQKEAEQHDDIAIKLTKIGLGIYDDDGEEVSSCIVEHTVGAKVREGSHEERIICLLRDEETVTIEQLKTLFKKSVNGSMAPKSINQAFSRAADKLLDSGRIKVNGEHVTIAG